jgi:hypothetical protein
VLLYAVKRRNAVDVDEEARLEQPHVERRHKTLPAGENPGVLAMRTEGGEDFLERTRAKIIQPGRLQSSLPSAGGRRSP